MSTQQKNESVEWLRHFSNLIIHLPVPPGSMLIHGSHAEVIGHFIKKQYADSRVYANLTSPRQVAVAQVTLDGFQMNTLDSVDIADIDELNSLFIELADCGGMDVREVLRILESKIACESSILFLAMQNTPEQQSSHLLLEKQLHSLKHWLCLEFFVAQSDTTMQYPETRGIAVLIHSSFNLTRFTDLVLKHGYISSGWWVLNKIEGIRLTCPNPVEFLMLCRLRLIVQWMKEKPQDERLVYFALAIQEFNQILASSNEHLLDSALFMSEAWSLLGDHTMASRIQRTACQFLGENIRVEPETESLPQRESRVGYSMPLMTWEPDVPPNHILFIVPSHPHYGLDCLYDGLYQVVRDPANLIEFPYKPTFHGNLPDSLADYPCCFNHDGQQLDVNHIQTLLNDKYFDVILWGDVEFSLDVSVLGPVMNAIQKSGIPVYLVDAADECVDYREKFLKAAPNIPIAGYFKREMLQCIDYGPEAFPLPFSYPDKLVIQEVSPGQRNNPIFWAGHRNAGFRRHIVEMVEYMWKVQLNMHYNQSTYMNMLRNSCIGLNCFGYGFDTVRYWEVPAQGCLLLSEKSPLCIPNNFIDGKNALFFEDLTELNEKLVFCNNNPEKVFDIALAGWNHFNQYHSNSKRAQYVLACIQQSKFWPSKI